MALSAPLACLEHVSAPLLDLLHHKDILIEGFGAGTSFSAVAGLIALSRSRFRSVLLCLGAAAMHPATFCTLLRVYTFYYERDLKAHKDFLEEKRPDKNTRPANYTAEHSPVEPQHGFLIVQHLHDRRAPWSLSPILLSYLCNKGVSQCSLSTMTFLPKKRTQRRNFSLAPTGGATDTTTKTSCQPLKPLAPPPFSPTSAGLLLGNNSRLEKAP